MRQVNEKEKEKKFLVLKFFLHEKRKAAMD